MPNEQKCDFEGCDRPLHARGLCMGHYDMWRRGDELKPIRAYNRQSAKGKVCTDCEKFKPRSGFYRVHPKTDDKTLYARCIQCTADRASAVREARRAIRGEKKYRLGELVQ